MTVRSTLTPTSMQRQASGVHFATRLKVSGLEWQRRIGVTTTMEAQEPAAWNWDCLQVHSWVSAAENSLVASRLAEAGIDGEVLCTLSENDL